MNQKKARALRRQSREVALRTGSVQSELVTMDGDKAVWAGRMRLYKLMKRQVPTKWHQDEKDPATRPMPAVSGWMARGARLDRPPVDEIPRVTPNSAE